jgi:hypothetical protein
MYVLVAMGAVIVVALLVAALVDYRRRQLGDTKSGDIWRSVRSRKADAWKRGERWVPVKAAGAAGGGTSRQSLSR